MTTNDAHAHTHTWDDKDGKDAAILQEMIDISNKYSLHNKQSKTKKKPRLIILDDAYASPDAVASSDDENLAKKEKMMDDDSNGTTIAADKDKSFELDDGGDGNGNGNNVFLRNTTEDPDLNQYWYSEHSIRVLCNAIREGLSINNDDEGKKKKRVAFLSAPSLFFSLPPKEREHCALFEYDASWSNCAGFQYYDFNDPTGVPERHRGKYDLIFMDPPFVSTSVWKKYAVTAKLLMNDDDDDDDDDGNNNDSRVMAATVDGNAILMKELFDCERVKFLPSIPNLVYQFCIYANFDSEVLAERNGELGG